MAEFVRPRGRSGHGRLAPWLGAALSLHVAVAVWMAESSVEAPGFAAPPALSLVITASSAPAAEAVPVEEPADPPVEPAVAPVAEVAPTPPIARKAVPLAPTPAPPIQPEETVAEVEPSVAPPPLSADQNEAEPTMEPTESLAAVSSAPASPTPSPAELEAARAASDARYRDVVRARVERKKQYPAMARRRGLEDRIWVEFEVRADGALGELRIAPGAHRVLARATQAAVAAAAPFPPPPGGGATLRIPVDYALTR